MNKFSLDIRHTKRTISHGEGWKMALWSSVVVHGCRMQCVWHQPGAHRTDLAIIAIVQLTGCQAAGVKRALEITFRDQRVQGSVETKFTPGETLEKSFGKQGESWSSLCLVTGFWNTGSLPVSHVNRTFCFLKIGR